MIFLFWASSNQNFSGTKTTAVEQILLKKVHSNTSTQKSVLEEYSSTSTYLFEYCSTEIHCCN